MSSADKDREKFLKILRETEPEAIERVCGLLTKEVAESTKRRMLYAVRALFASNPPGFLENLTGIYKSRSHKKDAFTPKQWEQYVGYLREDSRYPYPLVLLMYELGAKPRELLMLRRKDILLDQVKSAVSFPGDRYCRITDIAAAALDRYWASLPFRLKPEDMIFWNTSSPPRKLNYYALNYLLGAVSKEAKENIPLEVAFKITPNRILSTAKEHKAQTYTRTF